MDESNFLDVYPYMTWGDKAFARYTEGEEFVPDELNIGEHVTQPPPLLTETNLITAMEEAGIGTDATLQQHIETIQKRNYAFIRDNVFHPTPLGISLILGYR